MNDCHAPQDALGRQLREAREYLGFTEEEVGRHLELSKSEFSDMEGGRRQPEGSELRALAKLYGTSVEFLTGTDRGLPKWESFPDLDQASADLSATDRNEILRFAQFVCPQRTDG